MLGRSGMNRIIAVLVMLLMGSSWQIISHQHEIRKLNIALEKEKGRYGELKLDYQMLELKNSKDTATDHVESIAREKEEAEAAKKVVKPVVAPSSATTTTPIVPAKAELKKEVKVEDKSTNKAEVKPILKTELVKKDEKKVESKPTPKAEPKKEEAKPVKKPETIKPVVKKADPMDDQLGEFIKKQESKSN